MQKVTSEQNLQADLIVAGRSRGRDLAKLRTAHDGVGIAERRCVRCVERLQPKLRSETFRQTKRLVSGQIQVEESRPAQDIPSRVAIRKGSVLDERGCIEPFLNGWIGQMPVANHVRPIGLS